MSVRDAPVTFGPPISPPPPKAWEESHGQAHAWGPPRFGAGFETRPETSPETRPETRFETRPETGPETRFETRPETGPETRFATSTFEAGPAAASASAAGYRIRDDAVWERARRDYLDGFQAAEVCRRHDLGLSALRARARREGWRRADQPDAAPSAWGDGALDEAADDPNAPRPDAADLAEAAWRAGAKAIRRGRVYEARAWMRLAREMTAQAREDQRLAKDVAMLAAFDAAEASKAGKAAPPREPESASPPAPPEVVRPEPENVHHVHAQTRVHIAPKSLAPPPPVPGFDPAANLAELDAITAELDASAAPEASKTVTRRAVAQVRAALLASQRLGDEDG